MKKITIIALITAALSSANLFAHQIKNEAGHSSSWDWNNVSHSHEIIAKTSASTPTPAPTAKTIQGLRGLDSFAKVGECYTPAYVEASCKTETKKVLVKNAYDETEIVPAVTEEVTKNIMIEGAKVIEEYVPALYESITKRVLVEEARTEWKKGNFTDVTKKIGEDIYCLIEVQARYEDRVEKVLKIPETTKTRTVPAVYKTYKETVIVTPATTRVIKTHPAVYKTVEECVDKTAGHYDWRSILCEENATTSTLKSVEQALADAGHLVQSEVDGSINDSTASAIKSYQRSKGLAVDGLATIETIKSLGVEY